MTALLGTKRPKPLPFDWGKLEAPKVPTEPGAYEDLPFDIYERIPALNRRVLEWIDEENGGSPLHAKAAYEGKLQSKDRDSWRFGRAEHTLILEGEETLRERFTIATSCVGQLSTGKNAGQLCGKNASYRSTKSLHRDDRFEQADHLLRGMGFKVREISESGSRYYTCGSKHVRVADHDPNEKTAAWLSEVNGHEVRVDEDTVDVVDQIRPLSIGVGVMPHPLWRWYCGTHKPAGSEAPADFITEEHISRIRRMREAITAHPFNAHVRRPGYRELSIVYDVPVPVNLKDGDEFKTYEITIRHRCRIDRLAEPTRGYPWTIIDLKRMPVGSGSKADREKAILNAELHVQAYTYIEGARAAFQIPADERIDFIWLFVEEGTPHDVVPLPASPETLRAGKTVLDQRRRAWALCEHLHQWPGRVAFRQLEAIHVWGKQPPPPCEEPGGLPEWKIKALGANANHEIEGEGY